jgi:hypothetical protein
MKKYHKQKTTSQKIHWVGRRLHDLLLTTQADDRENGDKEIFILPSFWDVTTDELYIVNGSIDHLYTPLGTKNNYLAIADIHTLQITTACVKPFPSFCVFNSHSLATASNSGDSSASRAQVATVRRISRN